MSMNDTDHPSAETPPATDTGERTTVGCTTQSSTALERTPGGQPSNQNAFKHGLRSRRLFALGELPDSMRACAKSATALRLALERAILDRHGEISLTAAATISTAARWERHVGVCGHLLRAAEQDASLPAAERRAAIERLSEKMARGSAERDRAIERLHLERKPDDWIDALYSMPATERSPATAVGDVAGNNGASPA
jgi:hypothetical protein